MGISPLHYRASMAGAANDNAPTAAQMIGTAFHALLLEPELFDEDYVLAMEAPEGALVTADDIKAVLKEIGEKVSGTKPELISRLKELRPDTLILDELKHNFAVRNAGRTIISRELWEQLKRMRDAVMAHPAAAALMSLKGKAEQSVYWTDPATGVACRCRPDWWPGDIIVDLKTTDDASKEGFARSIEKYGYHRQNAFYVDGVEVVTGKAPKAFLFLAVEKDACVIDGQAKGVAVYRLTDESVQLGRLQYREALEAYAACKMSGKWPGYGDKIQSIDLPAWVLSRHADKLAS